MDGPAGGLLLVGRRERNGCRWLVFLRLVSFAKGEGDCAFRAAFELMRRFMGVRPFFLSMAEPAVVVTAAWLTEVALWRNDGPVWYVGWVSGWLEEMGSP